MNNRRTIRTRKLLAVALTFIVASAFTLAMPQETFAASKKCKTPIITYAASSKCNEITLKYKPTGKGQKASVYFVYMKSPSGNFKLVSKTTKKAFTAKTLKANTKYVFKVRAAKAYKQKQWYNKKTKKWQVKKPKKKYRGKARKVLKYKWYSTYSKAKTVKTKTHSFSMTTTQPSFTKAGSKNGTCEWCKAKTSSTFGTAGKDQNLAVKITPMQDAEGDAITVISWDEASGATGYIVERSENGGAYTDIFYSAVPYYIAEAASEGAVYSYRVTAYANGSGDIVYGKSTSEAEDMADLHGPDTAVYEKVNKGAEQPLLSAPESLAASPGYITVDLSWKTVPKAKKYSVYCGDEKVGETESRSYTVTDLTPRTKYSFMVEAHRDSLTSAKSGVYEVTTIKTPSPANLKAQGSFDSIVLNWDAVEGAEKYIVQNPVDLTWKNTNGATSYTLSGLESNQKYTIRVDAYVKGCRSDSAKVTAKTGFQAPGNLRAVKVTNDRATLTWDPVDGADSYRIYKENGTSVLATTSDCFYKITGLDWSKTYTYYVAAGCDGSYGLIDDDNKVTFKMVNEQEGFAPIRDITLTYGGTTFYLGQAWNTTLLNKLKAASDGFEQVKRPGYAEEMISDDGGLVIKDKIYDVTKYMFDTDDYSDFLAIEVADGKIIQWETNGPLFGTYYGEDVSWGDDVRDYPYGSYSGYRTNGGACKNRFTDIDVGDTIVGGFSFVFYIPNEFNAIYHNTPTMIVNSEKRIGYHYINAYRAAGNLGILEYCDALDGHDYTWSGEARGKQYTNTRYGVQAFVESEAVSDMPHGDLHGVDTPLTNGPLAGQTANDRNEISWHATGMTCDSEIVATGGIGEACLGAYMTSNAHLISIVYEQFTKVATGVYGSWNAVQFAR